MTTGRINQISIVGVRARGAGRFRTRLLGARGRLSFLTFRSTSNPGGMPPPGIFHTQPRTTLRGRTIGRARCCKHHSHDRPYHFKLDSHTDRLQESRRFDGSSQPRGHCLAYLWGVPTGDDHRDLKSRGTPVPSNRETRRRRLSGCIPDLSLPHMYRPGICAFTTNSKKAQKMTESNFWPHMSVRYWRKLETSRSVRLKASDEAIPVL